MSLPPPLPFPFPLDFPFRRLHRFHHKGEEEKKQISQEISIKSPIAPPPFNPPLFCLRNLRESLRLSSPLPPTEMSIDERRLLASQISLRIGDAPSAFSFSSESLQKLRFPLPPDDFLILRVAVPTAIRFSLSAISQSKGVTSTANKTAILRRALGALRETMKNHLKLMEKHGDFMMTMAITLMEMGEFTVSLRILKSLLSMNCHHGDGWMALSFVFFAQRDFSLCVSAVKNSLIFSPSAPSEIFPSRRSILRRLEISALFEMGKIHEGFERLKEEIQRVWGNDKNIQWRDDCDGDGNPFQRPVFVSSSVDSVFPKDFQWGGNSTGNPMHDDDETFGKKNIQMEKGLWALFTAKVNLNYCPSDSVLCCQFLCDFSVSNGLPPSFLSLPALCVMGDALLSEGKISDAFDIFRISLSMDSSNVSALLGMAKTHRGEAMGLPEGTSQRAAHIERALQMASAAIQIDGTFSEGWREFAAAKSLQGNLSDAEKATETAIQWGRKTQHFDMKYCHLHLNI